MFLELMRSKISDEDSLSEIALSGASKLADFQVCSYISYILQFLF